METFSEYCQDTKTVDELVALIKSELSFNNGDPFDMRDDAFAIRLALVRLVDGRDHLPDNIPTDVIALLNLCMKIERKLKNELAKPEVDSDNQKPTEKKQKTRRRGAGELTGHIEEAYKALKGSSTTQAQHLATWINNKYGDVYWKVKSDSVRKSQPWDERRLKKKFKKK